MFLFIWWWSLSYTYIICHCIHLELSHVTQKLVHYHNIKWQIMMFAICIKWLHKCQGAVWLITRFNSCPNYSVFLRDVLYLYIQPMANSRFYLMSQTYLCRLLVYTYWFHPAFKSLDRFYSIQCHCLIPLKTLFCVITMFDIKAIELGIM